MLIDRRKLLELQARIGPDALVDEPMWRHTSFRVGGPAALYVRVRSSSSAEQVIREVVAAAMPWRVLGGATNVLVADAGVSECVVAVDGDKVELQTIEGDDSSDEVVVRISAGCKLILAARRAVEQGLAGLEWAVGVPGTVGGGAVNNAGAHGSNMAALFVGAAAVDPAGTQIRLAPADMEYSYRYSAFKAGRRPGTAIISVDLRLRRSDRAALVEVANSYETTRKQRQPTGLSAGSVFKNPPGDYAGRLSEAAGMKGKRVGGAQVSPVHGNFFINTGNATASDIYRLMRLVQDEVWKKSSVWLEPELELLGDWPDADRAALRGDAEHGAAKAAEDASPGRGWAGDQSSPDFEPAPGTGGK
ncbi:MAG TPA: UDP-N-acetylmuramate dehydrogenase [Chloroflexota bacterium]